MNAKDFSDMAAGEVCERAGGIIDAVSERCAIEGCPLSPEQRKYLNTGVLAAFIGITDTLEGMARVADIVRRFAPMDEVLSDENLEAWINGENWRLQ